MNGVIASVDIGATNITTTLCNKEGILVRYYQNVRLSGDETTIPRQVKEMIKQGLVETGTDPNNLSAVGISSAGPFQKIDGMIELICHNLCGGITPERGIIPNDWKSIPLEREMRSSFKELVIENDAVSGAVAERTFGGGIGFDDLIYVTWSTGVGTGAYVDGRLIRGKNGNAPHGGHVYVGFEGPVCGCGNICDIESTSSGTAIALEYGGGVKTEDVFKAYHDDENAKKIVNDAARSLARGLASINCILDTRLVTIGGSVFLNNVDLLLPLVKEEFYRSFPALSSGVEIKPTPLGSNIGDVAAISLVIPDEWMEHWRSSKPWQRAPETILLE